MRSIVLVLLCIALLAAGERSPRNHTLGPDPESVPEGTLREAFKAFRANDLETALTSFQRAATERPDDPVVRAWLAEALRRTARPEDAETEARRALALDPKLAFAHVVLADIYDPDRGGWERPSADTTAWHLHRAVEIDRREGAAWLGLWKRGVYVQDPRLEAEALGALAEIGFFSPAAVEYNRLMLAHLPERAILLTNGDMDTYPAVMLQATEKLRPDVAVINVSMVNNADYAREMERRHGLPSPPPEVRKHESRPDAAGEWLSPSDQLVSFWIDAALAGRLGRPLTFAVTVPNMAPEAERNRRLAGLHYEVVRERPGDDFWNVGRLRDTLADTHPEVLAGSYTSDLDRSPVRIFHSGRLADNVVRVSLSLSEALIAGGQRTEGLEELKRSEKLGRTLHLPEEELRNQIERVRSGSRGN